jgi:hypothetical protein
VSNFEAMLILATSASISALTFFVPALGYWRRRHVRVLDSALYYRAKAIAAHRLYLEQLGRSAVFAAENELLRAVVKDAALPASARELLARGVN